MKSIYLLPGGFNSFVSYAFVYLFFLFYAFFVVFSPFYPLYALILMIPLPYLNDIEGCPFVTFVSNYNIQTKSEYIALIEDQHIAAAKQPCIHLTFMIG